MQSEPLLIGVEDAARAPPCARMHSPVTRCAVVNGPAGRVRGTRGGTCRGRACLRVGAGKVSGFRPSYGGTALRTVGKVRDSQRSYGGRD